MNLWFASMIFRNKSLQAHPMKLFMYIAVADSLYYSNQFFMYADCTLHLPQLMDYTVYFTRSTDKHLFRALYIQYLSVQTFEYFGVLLTFSLNFFLIFDLVMMIRHPFSDKSRYMVWYLSLSTVFAILVSFTYTFQIQDIRAS